MEDLSPIGRLDPLLLFSNRVIPVLGVGCWVLGVGLASTEGVFHPAGPVRNRVCQKVVPLD